MSRRWKQIETFVITKLRPESREGRVRQLLDRVNELVYAAPGKEIEWNELLALVQPELSHFTLGDDFAARNLRHILIINDYGYNLCTYHRNAQMYVYAKQRYHWR